eukprot:TRINITY_DN16845_c0_g1_i1.p1 TRINITY_DN16845_c0_g1~~TRINITY_DN16845_c0_g1_i1.p1  ORF type:complete len:187 (-),score=29.36 TRINITY_DN16845_c0_g1_i1:633-1193(-)
MASMATMMVQKQVGSAFGDVEKDVQGCRDSFGVFVANLCANFGFGKGGGDTGSDDDPEVVVASGSKHADLADILTQNKLPKGIFPSNIRSYTKKSDGSLLVMLPSILEVKYKDESVIRFDKKVTGQISQGCLEQIVGMKWIGMTSAKVLSITAEGKSKVAFHTKTKKSRKFVIFDWPREGMEVEKF